MVANLERRRVLVAARPSEADALKGLFASAALAAWEPLSVESFDRARFTLQHTSCDALLVDEGLCCAEGSEGLAWLARQDEVPTLFLAGTEGETFARAYEHGATICLPRIVTLAHPPLLAAALRRAAQGVDQVRAHRRTKDTLHQCRRQIDRLVNLLWRTAPMDTQHHWCTQRHILERLQEEVARTHRHGGPLSIAVGEILPARAELDADADLTGWVPAQVARVKRRCDVAGHYGLQGILLLMVQTPRNGGVVCCRRLRHALEEAAPTSGPRGPVRVAFGVASYSDDAATPQALLREAEQHLDAARFSVAERIVAG